MPSIRITREPLSSGTIHSFQYGQFIEYLCDVVPSMWAEKLYDGSFEGLTPYEVAFRKETDFKEKPWYPTGAVNRAEYSLDPDHPVHGKVSQRIRVDGGAPCTVSISQDGIAVTGHHACVFSGYLRQKGIDGPVQVRLHREGQILASSEFSPSAKWQRFESRLIPSRTEINATLTVEFRGPGTFWIDLASLMPEEKEGGWRPDVVDALRQLHPGIVRFGGSTIEYFDWRGTVGDPVSRKPFHAWGGLQPTAPGLEEIVDLIRRAGAEPLICVRFADREPKDAADQVEYFNGPPDSPMGRLRAAAGRPEPYGIRYWQVGNEVRSADYDARLAEFCRAMKAVDPTIRLLSSYPTPESIRSAAPYLDYVCPHQYGCADLKAMQGELDDIRQIIRENAPGRNIKVAVTEWNTTAGDFGLRRAMLWTLENALACSRYHNLLHRNADLVEIANRSNLTNSFCSGIIQTDNHRLYKTPTYYAQQLYATLGGSVPLRIESDTHNLDLSATLSADGRTVTLFAVNDSLAPVECSLDLSLAGGAASDPEVWTLTDPLSHGEPDVTNSFAEPDRVVPVHSRGNGTHHTFPALSLRVLRFGVRG